MQGPRRAGHQRAHSTTLRTPFSALQNSYLCPTRPANPHPPKPTKPTKPTEAAEVRRLPRRVTFEKPPRVFAPGFYAVASQSGVSGECRSSSGSG
ncbi:hypothetical protein GCM10009804_16440 [Kribbella hippodromi]|uniref:Uncharacterized protein n=1 Tax=Kribbella hippodromi TaxID=434347 RepID=A0ABP4NE42_9ACTN